MTRQKENEHRRDRFTFFLSFREQIDLTGKDKERLALYDAITDYAFFHKDTEFDEPLIQMAWIGIKPILDKGWRNYENGLNGGAPQGNENARKNNRETTEKQPKNNANRNRKSKKKEENKEDIYISGYDEENEFAESMQLEFPNVRHMREPLTLAQFNELSQEYGQDAVMQKLSEMENDLKTCESKRNVYKTLKQWLKR